MLQTTDYCLQNQIWIISVRYSYSVTQLHGYEGILPRGYPRELRSTAWLHFPSLFFTFTHSSASCCHTTLSAPCRGLVSVPNWSFIPIFLLQIKWAFQGLRQTGAVVIWQDSVRKPAATLYFPNLKAEAFIAIGSVGRARDRKAAISELNLCPFVGKWLNPQNFWNALTSYHCLHHEVGSSQGFA